MRALALVFVPAALAMAMACGEHDTTPDQEAAGSPTIPVDVGHTGSSSSTGQPPAHPAPSVSGTANTPPPLPDQIDLTTETTTFDGVPRSYFLAKPRDYDPSRSYPLVMLFHGNPGSKEQMRGLVPFENVSKRDAFLVYPDAQGGAWDLYDPTETNRDMNWIRDLPAELAARFNIDTTRVFGFGFSGGAFMMAQMGCRFGQSLFRAVMINSGGGPQESKSGYAQRPDECYVCPGGPIPSLIVHGDSDGTVVKESGAFTAKCVAETNGCSAFPNASVAPSPCLSAPGCQKPVEWCLIPKMGHAVWDQSMQTAWDFFKAS